MALKDLATLIGSRETTPDPRMCLKELNKVATRIRVPLGLPSTRRQLLLHASARRSLIVQIHSVSRHTMRPFRDPSAIRGVVISRRNDALGNVEHQVLANHFPSRNGDRDRSGCGSIGEDTRDRVLTSI